MYMLFPSPNRSMKAVIVESKLFSKLMNEIMPW